MWRPCPVVLDEPVTIFGMELEDFGLMAVTPLFLSWFLDTIPSFAGGFLLGAALYVAKRGRPPGALLHTLHGIEITRLPGVLSPAATL